MPELTPYGRIEALDGLVQKGLTLHLTRPDGSEVNEGGYEPKTLAPESWNKTDTGVIHPAVAFLFSGYVGHVSGYSIRLNNREVGAGTFNLVNVRNNGDKINVTPILN